jgi:GxxExxY protein
MHEATHDELTDQIIGAAIRVHKALGPGFLESIYENALMIELEASGLRVRTQVTIEILYAGVIVGEHRLDMIVEDTAVVELKAVKNFEDIHFSIVKSYMRASGLSCGLLLNFAQHVLVARRVFPHGSGQ